MSGTNGDRRRGAVFPNGNGTPQVPETQPTPATLSQSNGHRPSQSTDGGVRTTTYTDAYVRDYVLKLSGCNTIGELLKLLPVPVQPISRDILDGVYQASQKLGSAQSLLLFWQDRLQSGRFDEVSQLNSLKAPIVQVCKEAIGPEDGGLGSMTLDAALNSAKESALTRMIAIKKQEVTNLQSFVQTQHIKDRLNPAWLHVLENQTATLTTEHASLLRNADVLHKVAQVTASIGESSSMRQKIAKDKRAGLRRDADVDMTDASGAQSQKQLATLIEEVLKRKEQSRRDRARSGKGKGSSGISRQQMKKTQKKREQTKKKGGPRNDSKQIPKRSNAIRRKRR